MIDASLYVALSFALLVALAFYYRVPRRVLQALDSKSAEIAKQLNDARQLRDEAKAQLAEARRREADAAQRARAIEEQAEQLAKAKAEEIAAANAARLARQARQQELRRQHQEAEALRQLRRRSVDAALAATAQLLADELGDAQKQALTARSLERLAARLK